MWWIAALELTVTDRELSVGTVGDRFVNCGNGFVNGLDGGLWG
jgi:hypothetical protein